jgi:hypothetical protein
MIAFPDLSEPPVTAEPSAGIQGHAETSPRWYATESQKAGLVRLHALADIFIRVGDSAPGGFKPLLRPLIIGATGTGKSTLVREFARQKGWAFLSIDAGSWLIQGGYSKPPTLRVIRDHIRSAPRTCVYLDEACKMLPTGHDLKSGWYSSVFAECLSLADGDSRLLGHEWSREDIERFRESCFLIIGGAFTSALQEAKLSAQRGGLGFQQEAPTPATHSSKIGETLPPELFNRFNSHHIILESPTRQDYARAIDMIHADLWVERNEPIKDLLDQAQASGNGVRWLTDYLTRVLLENPTILPIRPEKEMPKKPEAFDFFSLEAGHYSREITAHSFDLRGVLARIYAEIQSRRSAVTRSRNTAFAGYLLGFEKSHLPQVLRAAIRVSGACVDITADESATLEPLMRWRDEAWIGLAQFPAELSRFGLLPLFSRSWDLTSRVCDLRSTLSHLVAAGRFSTRQ